MKDGSFAMDRDHSRIFNVHAWSEHKAVKELVAKIFASLSMDEQEKLLSKSNNKGKSDPRKQLRTVMVYYGIIGKQYFTPRWRCVSYMETAPLAPPLYFAAQPMPRSCRRSSTLRSESGNRT